MINVPSPGTNDKFGKCVKYRKVGQISDFWTRADYNNPEVQHPFMEVASKLLKSIHGCIMVTTVFTLMKSTVMPEGPTITHVDPRPE
jgi:hypothetical protein